MKLAGIFRHVVQLMFIRAPNRVQEVVSIANQAYSFVSVVRCVHCVDVSDEGSWFRLGVKLTSKFSLVIAFAPEFHVDMVPLLFVLSFSNRSIAHRYRLPIEITSLLNTSKFKKRRHDIGVCGDHIYDPILWYVWSTKIERHVDIFLESASFPGLKPVLANVIPIVGREDDVCVVQEFIVC